MHRFQSQIATASAAIGAAWRVQGGVQTMEAHSLDFQFVTLPCQRTEGFSRRM